MSTYRGNRRSSPAPRPGSASRPHGRWPARRNVTLAVRNTAAGEKVADRDRETPRRAPPPRRRRAAPTSPPCRAFAARGRTAAPPGEQRRVHGDAVRPTPTGWELQFATNHLGHFALAPACTRRSPRPVAPGSSRCAPAATCAHRWSSTTSTSSVASTTRVLAYGQSKTANVLFAVEATQPLGRRRHHANAVMPGGIRTTSGIWIADVDVVHGAVRARRTHAEDRRAGCRDLGPAWRPRRGWRGSAAGTSRTAPKLGSSTGAVHREPAASHATPSTRPTPNGCGTYRCGWRGSDARR